ncbi:MAG: hypothetical protein ACOYNC_06320 [Bacteroidales bacterium]
MKNISIIGTILLILLTISVYSQDAPHRYSQAGINFTTLNSFGLHFKTGGEKTLLRLSMLTLDLGAGGHWGKPEDSLDIKDQSFGLGFRVGFEKQVRIVEKFDFIWGVEIGANFNYQKHKVESVSNSYESYDWAITPLVDVIIGATYTIAGHLVLGAEITPGIRYSVGKTINKTNSQNLEQTNSVFNFGFDSNSASLSVAYRFGK